jgi:hypothetical protein
MQQYDLYKDSETPGFLKIIDGIIKVSGFTGYYDPDTYDKNDEFYSHGLSQAKVFNKLTSKLGLEFYPIDDIGMEYELKGAANKIVELMLRMFMFSNHVEVWEDEGYTVTQCA